MSDFVFEVFPADPGEGGRSIAPTFPMRASEDAAQLGGPLQLVLPAIVGLVGLSGQRRVRLFLDLVKPVLEPRRVFFLLSYFVP